MESEVQHDIVSILTADHDEIRVAMRRLEDAENGEKKKRLAQLKHLLEIHTKVEEEIVYPEFAECVGDEDADIMVQESIAEHEGADSLVAELEGLKAGSPEFEGRFKFLKESVEHHAGDEENEMFPRFRTECDQATLDELGEKVLQRKEELGA